MNWQTGRVQYLKAASRNCLLWHKVRAIFIKASIVRSLRNPSIGPKEVNWTRLIIQIYKVIVRSHPKLIYSNRLLFQCWLVEPFNICRAPYRGKKGHLVIQMLHSTRWLIKPSPITKFLHIRIDRNPLTNPARKTSTWTPDCQDLPPFDRCKTFKEWWVQARTRTVRALKLSITLPWWTPRLNLWSKTAATSRYIKKINNQVPIALNEWWLMITTRPGAKDGRSTPLRAEARND